MKVIITLEEKNKIIEYLVDCLLALTNLSNKQCKNFLSKNEKTTFLNNKLYHSIDSINYKLAVADDHVESLNRIFLFNEHEPNDESSENNVPLYSIEITESTLNIDQKYWEKYITKMQKDADVHYYDIQFNPGDFVFPKKEFNTKIQIRK